MSSAVQTQGTVFKVGDGGSPEIFNAVAEVVDFDGPGGTAAEIDVTNLGSTAKEYILGLKDEGDFSLTVNFIPGDAQQTRLFTLRDTRASANFKLVLYDGASTTFSFAGYVKQFSITGKADDKVVGKIALRITGAVTRS